VLTLVFSHWHLIRLIEQDVCGLQNGIAEQSYGCSFGALP
jgi:hypothetical protein